jgi:HlyD family secretion protein
MKKIIIPMLVLLAAAALAGTFFWRSRQPFIYAGTVESEVVEVATGLASPILAMKVKEGQKVSQGEVLAELDCREVHLAARLAEDEFARSQRLLKDGTLSKSLFDRARYTREDAAIRASWCLVKAPLNATVLELYQQQGEWTRPGNRILSLSDLDHLFAWVYVGQQALAKIKTGQTFNVLSPGAQAGRLQARVAFIRPEAEFTPKNVQTREERDRLVHGIKLDLGDGQGQLVPGMSVETALAD